METTTLVPDSLDAAWAEIEAAMPEGWRLLDIAGSLGDPNDNDRLEVHGWVAGATDAPLRFGAGGFADIDEDHGDKSISAWSETPAGALRALAARLRAR